LFLLLLGFRTPLIKIISLKTLRDTSLQGSSRTFVRYVALRLVSLGFEQKLVLRLKFRGGGIFFMDAGYG